LPLTIEKSLSKVFLGDTSLAVILDDREDVWKGPQSDQLLLVRPYKYFADMHEVNNASGISTLGLNQSASQQPAILLSSDPPGIAAPHQSMSDSDDQLLRNLVIIREIHKTVFSDPSSIDQQKATTESSPLSVSIVVNNMKRAILHGCVLTFSGIIPTNHPDPKSHFLWQLTRSLGAMISLELIDSTTHLICTTLTSNKAIKGRNRKDIWVLHPDWLFYCRWSMAKAVEATFSLVPLDISSMPNPPLLSDKDIKGFENANDESSKDSNEENLQVGEKRPLEQGNEQNSQIFKQARIRDADEESWIAENDGDDDLLDIIDASPELLPDASSGNNEAESADEDSSEDDWDLDDALKQASR
jgi:hypothetical protein